MTRYSMIAVALLILFSQLASAAAPVSRLCDDAARAAASEAGIPAEIMLALTRTETGRNRGGELAPWPWTVNMEGEGRWFDDRASALRFATDRYAMGARSFDIGCFQINHRWHGAAFASIAEMFDPVANARYAARFLNEIRSESGRGGTGWAEIAGAYHSRTPSFAKRYRERFARILQTIGKGDDLTAPLLPRPVLAARASATGTGPRPIIPLAQSSTRRSPGADDAPPGGVGVSALAAASALSPLFSSRKSPND